MRNINFKILIILAAMLFANFSENIFSQEKSAFKIARVKYSGGGDWYNDQSAEVNLLKFIRENTNINVEPIFFYVDLANDNLFLYPVIFLTGHGNINLTDREANNLRTYLENGGFLYIDDDYGLDEYIRKEIKKVFPDKELVEIPFNHPIYKSHFTFERGLPKIHEHDNKPPQGFGVFHNGRLCIFYTYETNLSDGWADPEVHKNPPEKRQASLKMGTNIIVYALTQ